MGNFVGSRDSLGNIYAYDWGGTPGTYDVSVTNTAFPMIKRKETSSTTWDTYIRMPSSDPNCVETSFPALTDGITVYMVVRLGINAHHTLLYLTTNAEETSITENIQTSMLARGGVYDSNYLIINGTNAEGETTTSLEMTPPGGFFVYVLKIPYQGSTIYHRINNTISSAPYQPSFQAVDYFRITPGYSNTADCKFIGIVGAAESDSVIDSNVSYLYKYVR